MSIWIGVLLIAVAVAAILFYQQYTEKKRIDVLAKNDFNLTMQELGAYDGDKKPRTFVAIKGDIFDVSSSAFYSKGGSYSIFAGKEASVSLAKGDLEGKFLNQLDWKDLSPEEMNALEEWHTKFSQKYRMVGKVRAN